MSDIKIFALNKTSELLKQIEEIAVSPAYTGQKIRIMPDAHAGKGSCVGFTSTFTNKICPNTVGVDIGCRVSLFETPWDIFNFDFAAFDKKVHEKIPAGFAIHDKPVRDFPYNELKCWDRIKNQDRIIKSLGTLGGGNHYIELDVDLNGKIYLAIHTGSRNLGVQICKYYQTLAIENSNYNKNLVKNMREAIITYGKQTGQTHLISKMLELLKTIPIKYTGNSDLAYIEGDVLDDYLNDMIICIYWSLVNHYNMASTLVDKELSLDTMITTVHNYVDVENHIIRKGAIDCSKDKCLIPLNMRDGILVIKGKEKADWNNSLPHGAGRAMSRAAARADLNLNEYYDTMSNIYSSCVGNATLDEAPMAYNSAEALVKILTDYGFEIIAHYKPIYNFKATN